MLGYGRNDQTRKAEELARTHGFRIFVVRAYINVRKGREPEDVEVGSPAQLRIVEIIEQLAAQGTLFTQPRPIDNGEPPLPGSSITVGEPGRIRDDLFHFVIGSGETGSHRAATRYGQTPLHLRDWSPEADHFVTLLFPSVQAERFLIIVQTIRRRDPLNRLLSRVTAHDLERKQVEQTAEEAERKRAREAGEAVPPASTHKRLLFEAHQAADNSYIDQIVDAAKTASAVFTRSIPSDRGRDALRVQRQLKIQLLDDKERDIARVAARRWSTRQRSGEGTSRSAGVSELGDLLETEDLLGEGEAAGYDTASVTVRSETSDTTTIAVDTMRDVFTYPVSDGPPTVRFYYDKVAPRLEIVAAEEGIEVDSINTAEVHQWLDDSISGP